MEPSGRMRGNNTGNDTHPTPTCASYSLGPTNVWEPSRMCEAIWTLFWQAKTKEGEGGNESETRQRRWEEERR